MYAGGDQEGKMEIPVKNRTDQFAESNRSFFESNKSTEPLGVLRACAASARNQSVFPSQKPITSQFAYHNILLTTTIFC